MIKKIKLWKMIVLSIITLGLYTGIWFALRRNEIVKKYKIRLPHWSWLFLPAIVFVLLFVGLVFTPPDASGGGGVLFTIVLGLTTLAMLAISVISLWWTWQFGKAVEKVTSGRITLGWVIAYSVLLGPIVIFVVQYYFNRLPKTAAKSKKYKPSKKFVMLSLVTMVIVGLIFTAIGTIYASLTEGPTAVTPADSKVLNAMLDKANKLRDQFNECTFRLDEAYPSQDDAMADQDNYNKAYDQCDSIRVKQNAAVDAYNKASGQ